MRPYLARGMAPADFFYESFKLAAVARYVGKDEQKADRIEASGRRLAAAHWRATSSASVRLGAEQQPNRHTLAELAFQLAYAGNSSALKKTLFDYPFMEARLEGTDVEALIADYDLTRLPEAGMNSQMRGP